jgi:hypothetical protein
MSLNKFHILSVILISPFMADVSYAASPLIPGKAYNLTNIIACFSPEAAGELASRKSRGEDSLPTDCIIGDLDYFVFGFKSKSTFDVTVLADGKPKIVQSIFIGGNAFIKAEQKYRPAFVLAPANIEVAE